MAGPIPRTILEYVRLVRFIMVVDLMLNECCAHVVLIQAVVAHMERTHDEGPRACSDTCLLAYAGRPC
jgi:hypothetical protein